MTLPAQYPAACPACGAVLFSGVCLPCSSKTPASRTREPTEKLYTH